MTKAEIEEVLERVKTWPEAQQADAAYLLLGLEQEDGPGDHLSEDDERALDEAEVEIARGEVAADEDVERTLQRLRQAR